MSHVFYILIYLERQEIIRKILFPVEKICVTTGKMDRASYSVWNAGTVLSNRVFYHRDKGIK